MVLKIFRARTLKRKLPTGHTVLDTCCCTLAWGPVSTFLSAGRTIPGCCFGSSPVSSACTEHISRRQTDPRQLGKLIFSPALQALDPSAESHSDTLNLALSQQFKFLEMEIGGSYEFNTLTTDYSIVFRCSWREISNEMKKQSGECIDDPIVLTIRSTTFCI